MTPSAPIFIDPCLCPLCGQSNQCANEIERATGIPQPPCWCTQATFDSALLERVPSEAKGKACVCPACARPLTPSCAVTPD
ncbi:MAG TPA: cysteine-rich CWC family protein [Rhodoferax sp.]|nr:cysteine-rich CWC family protein [Rhodoferax sp.]